MPPKKKPSQTTKKESLSPTLSKPKTPAKKATPAQKATPSKQPQTSSSLKLKKLTEKEKLEHNLKLKAYVKDRVIKCIGDNYSSGRQGYLIMVGGEALNFYLPKSKEVETLDFDLKLVVNPRFTDTDHDLRSANVLRLGIIEQIYQCLKAIKPPKDYTFLYPKITVNFQNQSREIKIDGAKVFLINNEDRTQPPRPFFYRFNKIFSIKLVYQPKKNPQLVEDFTLIDLGLYYRYPEEEPYYNFLTTKMYDTFIFPPFSRPIPIPFYVEPKTKVRYPVLPYLVFDNFKMILFAMDFLAVYSDDAERLILFQEKIKNYYKKMKLLLEHIKSPNTATSKELEQNKLSDRPIKDIVRDIEEGIKQTVKQYEPLSVMNAKCYREEGKFNYTRIFQESVPGCNQKYLDKVEDFLAQYQMTLRLINELMAQYNPTKRREK